MFEGESIQNFWFTKDTGSFIATEPLICSHFREIHQFNYMLDGDSIKAFVSQKTLGVLSQQNHIFALISEKFIY